ncbi:MAG: YbaB/EbfC family nucleoid-associated protein [Spirochaetes bacterium]|nr:YbaB/EbfC family nucleoid-associated protein [Spirochaetota bacterium]
MNPFDLLKQFQDMQGKMGEIQEKMKTITVEGTSGGDMVRIKINGQMEVLSVQISKEAVDPDDIRMLEDLVLAAFTDAMHKIKEKLREEMSSLTGGIDLPPGLLGM